MVKLWFLSESKNLAEVRVFSVLSSALPYVNWASEGGERRVWCLMIQTQGHTAHHPNTWWIAPCDVCDTVGLSEMPEMTLEEDLDSLASAALRRRTNMTWETLNRFKDDTRAICFLEHYERDDGEYS